MFKNGVILFFRLETGVASTIDVGTCNCRLDPHNRYRWVDIRKDSEPVVAVILAWVELSERLDRFRMAVDMVIAGMRIHRLCLLQLDNCNTMMVVDHLNNTVV